MWSYTKCIFPIHLCLKVFVSAREEQISLASFFELRLYLVSEWYFCTMWMVNVSWDDVMQVFYPCNWVFTFWNLVCFILGAACYLHGKQNSFSMKFCLMFQPKKISIPKRQALGDFFSFIIAMVDRVIWYLLLVGDDKYVVKLVEVCVSWFGHYGYPKKKF